MGVMVEQLMTTQHTTTMLSYKVDVLKGFRVFDLFLWGTYVVTLGPPGPTGASRTSCSTIFTDEVVGFVVLLLSSRTKVLGRTSVVVIDFDVDKMTQ